VKNRLQFPSFRILGPTLCECRFSDLPLATRIAVICRAKLRIDRDLVIRFGYSSGFVYRFG
jgi:hypothetical protein